MIRYRYAAQFTPPAPFVHVNLQCPATGKRLDGLAAQIDTAADRTVLPGQVVQELGLVEDGRLLFQGFSGAVAELPVFLVAAQVHDLPSVLTRAVLGAAEPHVLLGRDVLNAHRLLLDGPNLTLEMDRPATEGGL